MKIALGNGYDFEGNKVSDFHFYYTYYITLMLIYYIGVP